jgi:FG-GAP-like repeat
LHSLAVADVDGDGLTDLVTGTNKYNWANNDYQLPEADSDGVVYWFKLVRKPGGAVEFLPRLVYNNSGMGRQIQAVDLNKDGAMDIMTNGKRGTYTFWGRKGGPGARLESTAKH